MDKLINNVQKDLNKASKDNKVLKKADIKQDKKVEKMEKKKC